MIKTQNRDTAIDVARGIAALLMIIGHLRLNNGLDQFIYSFHMPLFFMISGMTAHEEQNYISYVEKRIRRILVPYIVFSLIFTNNGYQNWVYCLYGSRESILAAGSLSPLWFLPCLFLADIFFQLVLKWCKGSQMMIPVSIILAATGILLLRYLPLNLGYPFSLNVALTAIPFLLIGYYLKQNMKIQTFITENPLRSLILASVMLIAVVFTYSLNLPPSSKEGFPHVEMAIGSYGNVFLFYLTAILGSLALILFSEATGEKLKVMEHLGKCTIACLVVHWNVILLMKQIGTVMNINAAVVDVAAVVASVITTFAMQYVLERFAPNLVGKNG